jgi:2'-5' RNA ligase
MRLFIAIPLPDNIKKKLLNLQEPIRGVKWQKANQMHLTLRFLGEVSDEWHTTLKSGLSAIKQQPFTLNINGAGVFPNLRRPKVIWVGVEKSKPLAKLHNAVEKQCIEAGFEAEKRTFTPHITIGRVKRTSTRQIKTFIKSSPIKSFSLELKVDCFNLYRSELLAEGAKYTVIEGYRLTEGMHGISDKGIGIKA